MNLSNSGNTSHLGMSSRELVNLFLAAMVECASKEKEPSAEALKVLVTYDPDTGKMFWNRRPEGCFAMKCIWVSWNNRFAEKEAATPTWNRDENGAKTQLKAMQISFSEPHRQIASPRFRTVHRCAWIMTYGEIPEGLVLDHIDRDPRNNKVSNLHLAMIAENCRNRERRTGKRKGRQLTSKYNGICSYSGMPGKFRAQLVLYGKKTTLGPFDTEEEAALAREKIISDPFTFRNSSITT